MDVPLPQLGGCACGQVRIRLSALPLTAYLCHCSKCKRQSGSAFGISMFVPSDALTITEGEPARWERPNSAGGISAIVFCPQCASRLYTERAGAAHKTFRPGVLDDPSWVQPVGQMWTENALPWALLDDVLSYPGNPDSFQPMLEAWRALDIQPIERPSA